MIARYAKIVMALCLAVFCLLVAFNNITDYGTNHLFVRHVLSMDTTFSGNALMYRSVAHPGLGHVSYWVIIAAEVVTGILFLAGAIRLWQVRAAPAAVFNQAKGLFVAGCLLAFLVWFFGFMVVAGEWFAMWQSATWNGQDAAFRFYVTVLAVLIFVNQPDSDLAQAKPVSVRRAKTTPKRQPARRHADQKRRRTDKA